MFPMFVLVLNVSKLECQSYQFCQQLDIYQNDDLGQFCWATGRSIVKVISSILPEVNQLHPHNPVWNTQTLNQLDVKFILTLFLDFQFRPSNVYRSYARLLWPTIRVCVNLCWTKTFSSEIPRPKVVCFIFP